MKLFVVEGIDGSGKSTQIRMMNEYFSGMGRSVKFLHFPRTDAPYFGELIARFLRGEFGSLKEVNPWLVAMLYAGDRKDAADMISNWLKEGSIVLLDRYTYSNIAYQCAKLKEISDQDALMKWILDLEFSYFKIPRPDLNFFLDVPFSFTEKKLSSTRTGKDRYYLNGTSDIHEGSLIFQQKVREMYLRISERDRLLKVINCSDNNGNMLQPEEIFRIITGVIKEMNLL